MLYQPPFSEGDKINLDKNLYTEELLEAPKSINSGKAPGCDGLCVEIYKTFSELLQQFDMFNQGYYYLHLLGQQSSPFCWNLGSYHPMIQMYYVKP